MRQRGGSYGFGADGDPGFAIDDPDSAIAAATLGVAAPSTLFRGSIDILKPGGQDANSSGKRVDGSATPKVAAAVAESGSSMAKPGSPSAPKP